MIAQKIALVIEYADAIQVYVAMGPISALISLIIEDAVVT